MRKLILISIVFIFFACDNEPMEETNPFIGAWEWQEDGYIERFTFKDNEKVEFYFEDTLSENKINNPSTDNGTYQYTETLIYFNWNKTGESTANYILNSNTLVLTHSRTNKTITYNKTN